MIEEDKRIKELAERIQILQSHHRQMSYEINDLLIEFERLKEKVLGKDRAISEVLVVETVEAEQKPPVVKTAPPITPTNRPIAINRAKTATTAKPTFVLSETLENFIGTNLISKIGILITIIGVFIGAKYAIDKELISPVMRIAFGYAAGGALIFTAISLKKKYENFSAVLIGGGLAVMYFITYVSYSFYQLFPQTVAFLLMTVITACAVYIALWYSQKIIAIIGQVAAYAIPFLLSDGSGNVITLFTYISIINVGLLALSFKKNWKILYRLAFAITWLIYIYWSIMREPQATKFSSALAFLSVNFLTFYGTFLSYKIVRKELYILGEVLILLGNALLFFFLGAALIDSSVTAAHALTYFTICNAVIHLAVVYIVFKLKLTDETVYQFLIGLGFLFITIAIPVELNGSWVTLLWTVEALILSYIATRNKRSLFLIIAVPMIVIACMSLLHDWSMIYKYQGHETWALTKRPFVHLTFWFSLFVSVCFGSIAWMFYRSTVECGPSVKEFFNKLMPALFIVVLYLTFFNEINYSWHYKIEKTFEPVQKQSVAYFGQLSLYIYSFVYVSLLLLVNSRLVKSLSLRQVLLTISVFPVVLFLLNGLLTIGELREIYFRFENQSLWLLNIRYVCFLALASLIFIVWIAIQKEHEKRVFTAVFNVTLLSLICNEFVHWMDLAGYKNQYKLGLSVICALYALVLVFVGIRSKQKQLRIGAIVLFALTLLKLFFYDLQSLSSISKTIVLLILGVILLLVSFLYNKYKDVILGNDKDAERMNVEKEL